MPVLFRNEPVNRLLHLMQGMIEVPFVDPGDRNVYRCLPASETPAVPNGHTEGAPMDRVEEKNTALACTMAAREGAQR